MIFKGDKKLLEGAPRLVGLTEWLNPDEDEEGEFVQPRCTTWLYTLAAVLSSSLPGHAIYTGTCDSSRSVQAMAVSKQACLPRYQDTQQGGN